MQARKHAAIDPLTSKQEQKLNKQFAYLRRAIWDNWKPRSTARSLKLWLDKAQYMELRRDLLRSGATSMHAYIIGKLGLKKRRHLKSV
jgi:hypothetical protein